MKPEEDGETDRAAFIEEDDCGNGAAEEFRLAELDGGGGGGGGGGDKEEEEEEEGGGGGGGGWRSLRLARAFRFWNQ